MQKCPYCGSEDLITDPVRGSLVCGNPACGELLEESAMVTETTFLQSSNGAAAASGHRVMWGGVNFGAGVQTSSHELAVARGITKIGWIADRLQLSAPIQEAGRRMFQLAVQMNFNSGHPTRLVACACLYIVCRRNKSPHLLIDFADVLKEPVRKLGKIYTGLLKRLVGGDPQHQAALCDMVKVPMIDPSIYIERYARKLELHGMQSKVQNTAMRFIQLMNRDWISVGRRPNSICGAALYLASFHHGFRVPAKDIADMVRLHEQTLKNRLIELRETPLAIMSKEQFDKADFTVEASLEDERRALPPCMLRRRRMEARAALLDKEREEEEGSALAVADGSASPALKDAAASGEQRGQAKKLPPVPQMLPLPPIPEGTARSSGSASSDSHPGTASVTKDAASEQDPFLTPIKGKPSQDDAAVKAARYTKVDPSEENIEDIAGDILHALVPSQTSSGPLDSAMSEASGSIDALLSGKPSFNAAEDTGAAGSSEPASPKSLAATPSNAEGETLSDVDDDDLEAYLLDVDEQEHKSDIWHEVNKDYLEEWDIIEREKKRKRRQGQEDATSETGSRATSNSGTSSKRSRRMYPPASSCTQSAMMALSRKSKSSANRINLEALESLFS